MVPGPATTPLTQALPDEEGDEEEEEENLASKLPPMPVRSVDSVGPLREKDGGLGAGAFGQADGQMLSTMMRNLSAPLPSRWSSILLRRALLSNVPTPRGVSSPDWVAERAWLLLRMGEADSARMLIQSVDVPLYTPKLLEVAMQTSLALGDPGGMCPIAERGSQTSRATGWILARAMCAALAGEPGTASAAIEQARRARLAGRRTIDLLLAEKIVGAGTNGRRSVNIEWQGVDKLTTWRYGLAAAANVDIPANLVETAGPQIYGWRTRAAMLPDSERVTIGRRAAVLGVLSSAALVDLYGGVYDRTDVSEIAGTPPARLRDAYAGTDLDDRLSALRDIWDDGDAAHDRYANLIVTARASARVPVDPDYASDMSNLIGAMFTAGLDRRAARWSQTVEAGSDQDAWALLAVGSPRPAVTVNFSRAEDYVGASDALKGRFLVAALGGLGRLGAQDVAQFSEDLSVGFNRRSRWSQLLDRAVENRQPGTVALLVAVGMQTTEWRYVPPAHLYHIVSALRRVGLEPEARMIAAEALTRL